MNKMIVEELKFKNKIETFIKNRKKVYPPVNIEIFEGLIKELAIYEIR